ncbi:hypothetical protein [Rhizobium phaseoli]|uniref:hypothetical protein n=1 Tax=Rhizobium phaseoli TaxID=396 RepID=UPI002553087F|nr:hypothetical protein [Rhizobium phaseoli]MDK4724985.1 hypothetical protein [Rhizobium phaseoli]
MPLRTSIEARYPHTGGLVPAMRERLIEVGQSFLDSGHGDCNAEQRLCSTDTSIYWQQLSEVLLSHQLTASEIVFAHQTVGPDFRIDLAGRRIWVEVITPTPSNVPAAWVAPPNNTVRDFPHEEILLRWTAAIKQKAEVLLGNAPSTSGYLENGVVAAQDCYVIAVNGRLLRGYDGAFDALIGISQFPFAVEATLAVGPLQVRINRNTLQSSPALHQQRYLIHKPLGQPVPADTFLDNRFAPVSAIWATDVDEFSLLDNIPQMAVVHNPLALNPLPVGLLPAQHEYVVRQINAGTFQLDRVSGRTSAGSQLSVDVS